MRVKKKVTKLIIEIQIGEHIDRYRFLTTLTINTTTYDCMYEKNRIKWFFTCCDKNILEVSCYDIELITFTY